MEQKHHEEVERERELSSIFILLITDDYITRFA